MAQHIAHLAHVEDTHRLFDILHRIQDRMDCDEVQQLWMRYWHALRKLVTLQLWRVDAIRDCVLTLFQDPPSVDDLSHTTQLAEFVPHAYDIMVLMGWTWEQLCVEVKLCDQVQAEYVSS